MPRILMAACLALFLAAAAPNAGAAATAGEPVALASFEGRTIDLSKDWEGAAACTTDGSATHCFRSEAKMDRFLSGSDAPSSDQEALATCSTTLRLYDSTAFGGQVLSLSTRQVWTNLSPYGFDNRTSSFKIGACAAYLADASSGGTPWYPGSTGAGAQASTMASGWSNRISSVYIT